ncbi:MAG: hypothetical protein EA426_04620 [Spirochaetaceae bacterium]|nr:MAG: hypothetical protein EA426_04620 [Spirochaetaceae bacterium]
MSLRRVVLICALCAVSSSFVGATPWQIAVGPRIWGAAVDLGYTGFTPFEGFDTIPGFGLSAEWGTIGYFRERDGTAVDSADPNPYHARTLLTLNAGVIQSLVPDGDVALQAFLFYRGRVDLPHTDGLLRSSGTPSADGDVTHFILAGLGLSNVSIDSATRVRSGGLFDLGVEYGPRFLGNEAVGSSDFLRANVETRYYLPLVETRRDDGRNNFSAYLASMVTADFAFGTAVPVWVRQSFGGRYTRTGLGGSVRGFETGRFDADTKGYASIELRTFIGTAFRRSVVPGITAFVDAGGWIDREPRSPVASDNSGSIVSTGIGASIDVADILSLVFYTQHTVHGTRLDGVRWTPFAIGFGVHY